MIKNGTTPRRKDHRKYSFLQTFGSLTSPLANIPDSFNFDAGLTMPDQNADGLPYGCTGYTQSELCQDEDLIAYDPRFTYDNTLFMEGIGTDNPNFEKIGCQVKDSLKSVMIYGVKPKTGGDSFSHRKGAYYDPVDNTQGLDAFDALRVSMWQNYILNNGKRTISISTPWLPEWFNYDNLGVVPSEFNYSGNPADYSWHNWKIAGFTKINNELVAIGKTWQGATVGDKGWLYFRRETINAIFGISTVGSDMFAPVTQGNIATVKLTIIEQIISYFYMYLAKFKNPPTSVIQSSSMDSQATLEVMCTAIRDNEGNPGDLNYRNNNPGNCRYNPSGYLPIYGLVEKDPNNFAIFKDYATGWLYLENLVKEKLEAFPDFTILQFFSGVPGKWAGYAPAADKNDPLNYATFVAKRMGVGTDYQLKNIIV
jgi:hypothetical protein